MMRHITANSESGTVRNGQEKLVTALEMLFNLLEEYARSGTHKNTMMLQLMFLQQPRNGDRHPRIDLG